MLFVLDLIYKPNLYGKYGLNYELPGPDKEVKQ